MKYLIAIAIACLYFQAFSQSKQWVKNTFPGQGHVENHGPWKERQGSDRAEWVSAFGVSSVIPPGDDAPLMLQVTDLATLQYSSDGKEFKRANIPLTRGGAVAFNPHDGKVGYALMEPDPELDLGGWWRTEDKGETWQFMFKAPLVRGQRNNLLEVNLNVERPGQIYLAAGTPADSRVANFPNFVPGLYCSLDNGNNWALIDFSGEEIYQIRFNADGTVLYVLTYAGGTRNDEGGSLYTLRFDGTGTDYTKTFVRGNIRNMDADPQIADKGLFLNQNGHVYSFSYYGASNSLLYDARGYRFVEINPSNNQHIILYTAGLMEDDPFVWSNDGGTSWHLIQEEGDYFPTWYDYAPINHSSDNYWYKKSDGTATIVDGTKDVFAFWPNDSLRVINWATNIRKGPLMSLDYGRTFKPFAHGGSFKGTEGGSLGDSVGVIGLAKNEYGFVLTKDNGITWKGHSVLSSPELMDIYLNHPNSRAYKRRNGNSLDFNPTDNDIVIGSFGITPTYIVRSEDFGETWESVGQFNPTDFDNPDKENLRATKVFWHNQKSDIVYVGSMKSINGGQSFNPMTDGHFVSDMHEKNGDVVLSVEVPSEIYLSYDAGATWGRITDAPSNSTGNFAAVVAASGRSYAFDLRDEHDPAKGGRARILAGGEFGIYEFLADASDSYTGQWRLISKGFDISTDPYLPNGSPYYYSHVAVDQREGHHNKMYVVTGATRGRRSYYRQAYQSIDYGESWTSIMDKTIPGSPHYVSAQWSDVDWNGNFIYNDWDGMFTYTDMLKVDIGVNLPNSGTVTGDTLFAYREQVALQAIPESGFEFIGWWEGDSMISTDPNLSFIGYENKKLGAIFNSFENMTPTLTVSLEDVQLDEDAGKTNIVPGLKEYFSDPEGGMLFFETKSTKNLIEVFVEQGALIVKPAPNFFGEADAVVSASDGSLSVSDTVKLLVIAINDPPVFSLSRQQVQLIVNFGQETIFATLEDAPFGEEAESVFFSLSPPSVTFADVSMDGHAGIITFQSKQDSIGAVTFKVIADDGQAEHNLFEQELILDVTESLGIDDGWKKEVNVYPNPACSSLKISQETHRLQEYTLNTLLGHCIKKGRLEKESTIELQHIPNGLYLLRFDEHRTWPIAIQHL